MLSPVSLKARLKPFRQHEPLHRLVGVFGLLGDGLFLTKRGDIGLVLAASPRDGECLDPEQFDAVARRFETGLRHLGERTRLYQYLIKSGPVTEARPEAHPDPVVARAQKARWMHLRSRSGLFEIECYFVLIREPRRLGSWASRLAGWFSGGLSPASSADSARREIARLQSELESQAESFATALSDVLPTERLDRAGAYGFLRRLLNPDEPAPAPAPSSSVLLDYHLCGSALECHRDHLRLGDCCLNLLALKEPPPQTSAHLLRSLLCIPASMFIVSEWRKQSGEAMRRRIRSMRRHFFNSKHSLISYVGQQSSEDNTDRLTDEAAAAHVDSLGECLKEIDVNGRRFGEFSVTVALLSQDRSRLSRAAARTVKVMADAGASVIVERLNQLNSYLALLPGNSHFNLRRQFLMDANAADLFLLFGLNAGSVRNRHLGAAHLATFETPHGVPYRLNLHDSDLAHSLVIGSTGSGKSFLLNFLLTHLQQYSPQTLILDLGQGYESLTELFGGSYLAFGLEKQVRINPFSLEPSEDHLEFLHAFCSLLLQAEGDALGETDQRDLFRQIKSLYGVPRQRRTLSTLAAILRPALRRRLKRWLQDGQYGRYFDNVEDDLSLADFQCLDFQGLERSPLLLQALLFYVLHRADQRIRQPEQSSRFKLCCVDEAWRFLSDAEAGKWLAEALKTWRKHNAAVLLASQSSSDLGESALLQAVLESCANKIFLANPGMDRGLYRELFNLNRTEARMIADLLPRRQLLLKRREHAKVLELTVGKEDYWLYTSDPYERARRHEAVKQYGLAEALLVLAAERPESSHAFRTGKES